VGSSDPYPLEQFRAEFPDAESCLEFLWREQYAAADGEHAECPGCGSVQRFKRYSTAQKRQSWTCTACGHHIQPTAHTIFHKSSTPLDVWFTAIYLIHSTAGEISAKQLERELGVTYKTAWRMSKLIRERESASELAAVLPVPALDVAVTADRPAQRVQKPAAAGHRNSGAGGSLLSRRLRRQVARFAHDERVARHHASALCNQGIAAVRHEMPAKLQKIVSRDEPRPGSSAQTRNRPDG
jgi:transposase-like protein